jgi:hypothetical protein
LLFVGCVTPKEQLLHTDSSQVQLRSIQTRVFDTTDKEKTLRTIIATLQDLGFVLDKADATLGSVTATKLNRYALRITITVRLKGEKQMLVRANAQYETVAVEDPLPYQQFFTSLEKAMFLTAHLDEDSDTKNTDTNLNSDIIEKNKPKTKVTRNAPEKDTKIIAIDKAPASAVQNSFFIMHEAAFKGDTNLVETLIKAGEDVNAKDSEGNTPLHKAVSGDHVKIVELLIKGGANVNSKNTAGEKPFKIAIDKKYKDVWEMLYAAGATVY